MICIPKSTISAYENDKVDIKGSVLVELSEHLDTTPNFLLGVEERVEDTFVMEINSLLKAPDLVGVIPGIRTILKTDFILNAMNVSMKRYLDLAI